MQFWDHLDPKTLVFVCALLLLTRGLLAAAPVLKKAALPAAIVAGLLGLAVGPGVLGAVSFETRTLETVVYHCLGLLYVCLTLQAPPKGVRLPGARSFSYAAPVLILAQGALGLLFVLGATLVGTELHPGFGLMLALGFSQGPGQALALGSAWEGSAGFVQGGQAGLLMATLGFLWCSAVGVALFHLGRRRGWARARSGGEGALEGLDVTVKRPRALPGDLDHLSSQLAVVGGVYLLTWGALTALTPLLPDPGLVERLWGFHFIFALGITLAVRKVLEATGLRDQVVNDETQNRFAGVLIDLAAVCAIAAVRLDLLGDLLGPALLLALLGGACTTAVVLWLAPRVFPNDPFAHMLVLFGMSTGTLPTGLVLLRLEDPGLQSNAARNVVLGMPGAVLFSIPALLLVVPLPIRNFPSDFPGSAWLTAAICLGYAAVIAVLWRSLGPARSVGGVASLWPTTPHPLAQSDAETG